MDLVSHALRGATSAVAPSTPALQHALVVGAGGKLGSALLGEALAPGRFRRVSAVINAPLTSTLPEFDPLPTEALARGERLGAELAFIVYERERHANGRDEAFLQPDPDALLDLARTLHVGGVRRLLVVLPHAPALLPHALKAGFASQAEREVAGLGFEQLVFLRAAQEAVGSVQGSWLRRFAHWWLTQLRLMVPKREQPVLATTLAGLVVGLARRLPQASPGTRVLPPEVMWEAAQGEADAVLGAWLGIDAAPAAA